MAQRLSKVAIAFHAILLVAPRMLHILIIIFCHYYLLPPHFPEDGYGGVRVQVPPRLKRIRLNDEKLEVVSRST